MALAASRRSEGGKAVGVDLFAGIALSRVGGGGASLAGYVTGIRNTLSYSNIPVEVSSTSEPAGSGVGSRVRIAGRAGSSVGAGVAAHDTSKAGAVDVHVVTFAAGAGVGGRQECVRSTGQTLGVAGSRASRAS